MSNAAAYDKTPLKQIGAVVAWHEDGASNAAVENRARHKVIAKRLRKSITDQFIKRFTRGDDAD